MNPIFEYNGNAKYLTKDLNGNYFSLLDVYLNGKKPSVKIQLLNIFKDHHAVAKSGPIPVGCGEWLFYALWMRVYNSHGNYKPELNDYFHMYQCQLNFAMFCAASVLGFSWQELNHPDLLVCSVYRFHMYFHVRITLHHLGISLPLEDNFHKVKNSCIRNAYYSICDDYGVNAEET